MLLGYMVWYQFLCYEVNMYPGRLAIAIGNSTSETVLPSEKYFRASTNRSSAWIFLLSFSATLKLLLLLRLDRDSLDLGSDSDNSDRLCFAAISTLLKLKNTVLRYVFSHSNKTQIFRATVCSAPAQCVPSAQLHPGSCSLLASNRCLVGPIKLTSVTSEFHSLHRVLSLNITLFNLPWFGNMYD